jgi:hypothetical protein
MCERLIAMAEVDAARPAWASHDWPSKTELDRAAIESGYELLPAIVPDVEGAYRLAEAATQHRDTMFTASALVRYRRKRQVWPQSLKELVPEYLAELPVDRMSGKELGYRRTSDGPLLYSVGSDLDDDGGRAVRLPPKRTSPGHPWHWTLFLVETPLDGDLVLWPLVSAEEIASWSTRSKTPTVAEP